MRCFAVILSALLLASLTRAASLEVTLIRASNEGEQTDKRLKDLEPKLKKVFGFQNYRRLGQQTEALTKDKRKLINLGEGFTIFVTPKGVDEKEKTHTLDLEWYSGKAPLVKTTIHLTEKKPFLIKGPEVGQDWILLALTVQP